MVGQNKSIAVIALTLFFALLFFSGAAQPVQAHGSMEQPVSRVYNCYQEGPEHPQSAACQAAVQVGGTQQFYNWHEVNRLPDGKHRATVPDGQLCSAGKESHKGLDLARSDWVAQAITPDANGSYEFVFYATAPHSTRYFDFYVTQEGYNPAQPLRWADLEATPFCSIPTVTLDDGRYHMSCPLPAGKQGKHVIYNIWQRDDSPEAFYTCMDVEFGGNGTPMPTTVPSPTLTPTPAPDTPSPTPISTTCQVKYTVTDQWSNGFNANVQITNQGATPIEGWALTWNFSGNQTITQAWDGTVVQINSTVTMRNTNWNKVIAANGGQVSFGFGATFQAGNPAPTRFALNDIACNAGGTQPTVTPAPVTPSAMPTPSTTPQVTPTTTLTPTRPPGSTNQQVVAYFTQWGIYERNYHVKQIVTSGAAAKITVINYAFGNIVDGACVMTTQAGVMDAYADYQKSYTAADSVDGKADVWDQPLRGNFNQLRKLKQMYPHIKVLISLGGWSWSGGFHDAAKTPAARQKVAQSCIDLYIRGNLPVADNAGGPGAAAGVFDGIDIDWEYPAAPGIGNPYGPEDTHNFTLLLQEFRNQLDLIDPKLLLTVATAADVDIYSLLELDQIHPLLNHINLMTYDMHGAWESISGINAPLYPSPNAPYSHPAITYSVDSTVQGYLQAGVPAAKLILGIPFYGRGWTGVANANHGRWQASSGAASGTWEAGIEDYKVLKALDYPIYRDEAAGAVWKYNGTTFWSYDDPQTIAAKLAYLQQQGLGGVMVWSLDGDDASGELLSAVQQGLAGDGRTPEPATALYLPLIVP